MCVQHNSSLMYMYGILLSFFVDNVDFYMGVFGRFV